MNALPQPLYDELVAALVEAGRDDLVAKLLPFQHRKPLTSGQAAEALGLSSPNTVKNWLSGGHFPGAYQTRGGHWRFPADEVDLVKTRMAALAEQSRSGALTPPDLDDDDGPPLL